MLAPANGCDDHVRKFESASVAPTTSSLKSATSCSASYTLKGSRETRTSTRVSAGAIMVDTALLMNETLRVSTTELVDAGDTHTQNSSSASIVLRFGSAGCARRSGTGQDPIAPRGTLTAI